MLRQLNVRRIMEHAWDAGAFTASDAMSTTGLTRSTVISACDDLVRKGWLDELGDARAFGDYEKGRPARRYALRDRAGVVIGVDAGWDRMSATVADLRGNPLGRAQVEIPAQSPESNERLATADDRRVLVRRVVDEAVATSAVDPGSVLALTIGVPAPVDAAGASPSDDEGFWHLMNPDLAQLFAEEAGLVTVENDANLAAIAEGSAIAGLGRDVDSFISLLVGEGIGAGLMIDRRLVRGRRGAAGEMRFLDHVEGVGSANGLPLLARRWAAEAIHEGRLSPDSALAGLDPDALDESDVVRAAESGDDVAIDIIERLGAVLARICIVLGVFLDVDRVVVGGAIVGSLSTVIDRAGAVLAESGDPTAPELVASALGRDAVAIGAVEHALTLVRAHALELLPADREVA